MSEKRLVSERYGEPVFPNIGWSPTVGEVVALIHFAEGQKIDAKLLAALDDKNPYTIEKPSGQFRKYNNLSYSKHRKLVGSVALEAFEVNVLRLPNTPLMETEEQNRRDILAAAIREIGAEMLTDQR